MDWLEEPLGFRARSSTLVPYLMTRAAEQVARRTGENWTLAPSGPEAIRWLAQPAPKGKTETSIALGLPALPALRDDVTMQQILELRADNGFAQARAEYVAHIAELTEAKRRQLQLRLNDPHSDRVLDDIALSLDEEMRRATTSWWRRLKRQDYWAIGVGVGTMAVTALGSASTPSLTVASTALAGLSAATPFVTRRGTPSFLRLTRTILAPA